MTMVCGRVAPTGEPCSPLLWCGRQLQAFVVGMAYWQHAQERQVTHYITGERSWPILHS